MNQPATEKVAQVTFVVRWALGLVLVGAVARGVSWAIWTLAIYCALPLAVALRRLLQGSGQACKTPCSCGCKKSWEEIPGGRCGETCQCGCDRPCIFHPGHCGGCGS